MVEAVDVVGGGLQDVDALAEVHLAPVQHLLDLPAVPGRQPVPVSSQGAAEGLDPGAQQRGVGLALQQVGVAEGSGVGQAGKVSQREGCLLYTSPSPRDRYGSRMPSSA